MIMCGLILHIIYVSEEFVVKTATRYWYLVHLKKILSLRSNVWDYDFARLVTDDIVIFSQVIKQSQKYMSICLK